MRRKETNRDHRAKASIFDIENHFVDNFGPDPESKRHEQRRNERDQEEKVGKETDMNWKSGSSK